MSWLEVPYGTLCPIVGISLCGNEEGPKLTLPSGRLEEALGAVSAAGYVLAQACTGVPPLDAEHTGEAIASLARLHEQSGAELLAAVAGEALGHVGLRGPLPLPPGNLSEAAALVSAALKASTPGSSNATTATPALVSAALKASTLGSSNAASETGEVGHSSGQPVEDSRHIPTRTDVVVRASRLLQSADAKIAERSVRALGHICYGETHLAGPALEALFSLARSKVSDDLVSGGHGFQHQLGIAHALAVGSDFCIA